jgi:sodium-coupled neutral amino acid transporter 11
MRTIALLGMLIIVLSVLIEGSRLADPALRGDPSARFTFIEPRIFEAIGVISFAFVCHHNSLLIYGSLQTPTLGTLSSTMPIRIAMRRVVIAVLLIL